MGVESEQLCEEIILRLRLVESFIKMQEGLDSYYHTHIELDKRIKAQLDAIDANLEQQIRGFYE